MNNKLKDTMLMKTNAHFVNNPGWGISFMIDGHKFHAKEGSDLCDLVRSMVMGSVDSIKKAIDIRGYEENTVYNRCNELYVKRNSGTAIFDQSNLFEAVKKSTKDTSTKITKKMVGESKMAELKQQKKEIKTENPSAKVINVNIAQELSKLETPKQKVEVIREVVSKPSVVEELLGKKDENKSKKSNKEVVNIAERLKESEKKVNKPISEEESIYMQYMNKLKELKVEKLSRDEARRYKVRTESPLFNKSHSTFLKMYEEWKEKQMTKLNEDTIESVFKKYESKLLELHIDKLKRDDARKMHINYSKYTAGNYGMFLDLYAKWKAKNS